MELLETIQFSLLRLASALCVPLALFTVVTTARRPDPYERYAWGVFSLALLTLTWLLNAYLNQNSRLLAFVYPLFYGWVALAGPAYYFSLVGRRPLNLSFTLLHLVPAILVFTSGFIGIVKGPLVHDQLELLFISSERISALAWSMLGDTTLSTVLLPIHFGAYALSAVWATKDKRQIVLTIPLFVMMVVFTILYLSPGNTKWLVHIPIAVIEYWAFTSLVYLLLTDTPKVQYDRKSKLKIEPQDYDEITLFLEDMEGCEKILRSGGSYDNIEMLPGDQIIIPTKDMTVEIRLANTEAANYGNFAKDYARESVNVAYVAGKSARWYVKNMVGGFGDDAKRTDVNVVYANGSVKDFKWRRLKYRYPKVKPGAMVVVGAKPIKEKETGKRFDSDFDWQEFSGNLLSQISAVFTVVVLANQL